jgi:hypothetical protein
LHKPQQPGFEAIPNRLDRFLKLDAVRYGDLAGVLVDEPVSEQGEGTRFGSRSARRRPSGRR